MPVCEDSSTVATQPLTTIVEFGKKSIILCADDYGFNQSVSSGILTLIANKRLSAVSCITNFPDWPLHANNLKGQYKIIDIGLHFNLTDGNALTTQEKLFPLTNIIILAYLKKIDKTFVMNEFENQLSAFIDNLGFPPDFIDGHQHIQQLPIIRDALIEVYLHHFPTKNVYFRVSTNGFIKAFSLFNFPKPLIIHLLGASHWQKQLKHLSIPHNQSFSGIYNFANAKNYREYFKKFLDELSSGGLLMCHPGAQTNESDLICSARLAEYNYFNSDLFLQDCQNQNITLTGFMKRK